MIDSNFTRNSTPFYLFAVGKELKEAFRLYDKEGNGFIPTSCLKEILKELDDQLSDADLNGMITEIDSDGSGTVDFDGELLQIFKDGFEALRTKTQTKFEAHETTP